MKMKPVVTNIKVDELFNFTDKVVFITGAGGVGRICAKGFGLQKARIVLFDVKDEVCEKTCSELKGLGIEAAYVTGNIAEQKSVNAAVDEVVSKYGRIDILIHTAGVTKNKVCTEHTQEGVDFVIDINLKGTIYVNQAVARVMKKQNYGKIVDIGSVGGALSHMDVTMTYEASKAGVHAIVKSFANEMAPYNINVNAIAPFWINTPFISHQPKEYFEAVQRLTPFKRCLEAEELVGAAYYLASDASNFVTGQVLFVDGGYTSVHAMSMEELGLI